MSNAKVMKNERYIHEGDYTFVVPGNVTRLHARFARACRYKFAAGATHAFTIDSDGELWGWGAGSDGQLGANNTSNQVAPRQGLTTLFSRFKRYACGSSTTIALTESGVLYMWGWAGGNGLTTKVSVPTVVNGFTQIRPIDVFPSGGGAFVKDESGQVWAIGDNGSGKLGTGTAVFASNPVLIAGNLRWKRVIGSHQSWAMGLSENGNLYAWGTNGSGQFGNGTVTSTSSPVISITAANASVRDFHPGSAHMAFVFNQFGQEGSAIFTCGNNASGQLGDNTVVSKSIPVLVSNLPTGKRWKQVACGDAFTLALSEDGDLYGWGNNAAGQIPATFAMAVSTPVLLNAPGNWNVKIREVSAGQQFALAVDTRGQLWSWGSNSSGQLGNGGVIGSGIFKPDFNWFGVSGYVARYPMLEFQGDEILDVVPGETLTIKIRQEYSSIVATRNALPVTLFNKNDTQAIGFDYWGD